MAHLVRRVRGSVTGSDTTNVLISGGHIGAIRMTVDETSSGTMVLRTAESAIDFSASGKIVLDQNFATAQNKNDIHVVFNPPLMLEKDGVAKTWLSYSVTGGVGAAEYEICEYVF